MICVYSIRNTITDKRYIGSALDVESRFRNHLKLLHRGVHHSQKLQRSWLKHGKDVFVFEVLESVTEKTNLLASEQKWIDHYNASEYGYNVLPTAGSQLGVKRSNECRAKIAAWHRGRSISAEVRKKISLSQTGKKSTPEQISKMLATKAERGWRPTPEQIEKAAASHRGKKRTLETKMKIGAKRRKPVECVTLGLTFESLRDAAKRLGLHKSAVSRACLDAHRSSGGMKFRFL